MKKSSKTEQELMHYLVEYYLAADAISAMLVAIDNETYLHEIGFNSDVIKSMKDALSDYHRKAVSHHRAKERGMPV